MVDSDRRPLGWLSDVRSAGRNVPQKPDSGPEPMLDLDDVMRDALADLLQSETQYAPVTDANGRIAGVLSVEIISEFLGSPEAKVEEHSAIERPWSTPSANDRGGPQLARSSAQVEIHNRTGPNAPCQAQEGKVFCLQLGDRQLRPLHPPPCSTSCCSS